MRHNYPLLCRRPGRWHPRCGIDFVKYEGTNRKVGAELNIIKRERLEALRLEAEAIFTITLHNTVAYGPETLRWLAQFETWGLSGNQKRIMASAKEHGGALTSHHYQELVGIDLYTASRDIKELIRKGLVKLPKKGGRVYELVSSPKAKVVSEKPPEYLALEPVLKEKGYVKNEDIRKALTVPAINAKRIAQRLVAAGWLRPEGERRGRRYILSR